MRMLLFLKNKIDEAEVLDKHNEIKQTTRRSVSVFSLLKQKFFIKVLFLDITLQVSNSLPA